LTELVNFVGVGLSDILKPIKASNRKVTLDIIIGNYKMGIDFRNLFLI